MEFFYIDKQVVPSGNVADLLASLLQRQDLKIVQAYDHKQAPKFKAHSNFEAKWTTDDGFIPTHSVSQSAETAQIDLIEPLVFSTKPW